MAVTERHFILPFLFLIAVLCYDSISLRQKSSNERYDSTKQIVKTILQSNKTKLLNQDFTALLTKSELDLSDLNKIKEVTEEFSRNSIQAELYKGGKKIFWTTEVDSNNICQNIKDSGLTGRICYTPFDNRGYIDQSVLEQHQFKNYFKRDFNGGAHEIMGTSISLGKTFRSSLQDKLLILGYLLSFCLISLLSIKHRRYWPVVILVCLRCLSILQEWTGRFYDRELTRSFSDVVNYNSLDLILDSLLLFCISFFVTNKFVHSFRNKMTNWGMAGLSFVHMLVFISHIRLLQLLVRSEHTSLSIEDLGSTSIADFIVFVSIVLLQLSIFHFGHALFKNYKTGDFSKVEIYSTYAISISIAVVMGYFLKLDLEPGLLVLFLFCYILLMDLFVDVKSVSITWVIWWGIFYAIYLSALFFNYDIKKEIKQRQAFLESVFHNIPSDRIAQLKNEGISNKIGDLVNSLLILPDGISYNKADLETYVAEKLKRDDIILELYDKNGLSLFDDTPSEHSSISKLLEVDSLTHFDEIYNCIWFKNQISPDKKLFVGISKMSNSTEFPFAFNYIRENQQVIKKQDIRKPELKLLLASEEKVTYVGSDVYTVYRPSSKRMLVSKKSFLGLVKPVALFSFLFSIIIILILTFGLIHYFLKFLPEEWPLFVRDVESLNSKIQISLIMVILLSFVIIASITSTFLKDYLTKEKDLVITEKLENVAQEFKNRAKYSTSSSETVEVLANYKNNIEDIHNVNLDFFPIKIEESNLDYFTQMYFQKQTDPYAYSSMVSDEYSRSFIPIFYESEVAGVAALEMKSKVQASKLNVFDFLGSIFNVYVFLFLIASVISIFIAQSITRPLSMLNQTLKQVKLGKQNKQLEWNRDDEIGILIGNYNTMVSKLEESAEIMAKNERDSAWREMAKQVAHEIKNPLTPMKLSIQYLEKAIKQQPENAPKIAKKISSTMLEQIDNLTGIAEAFGNFAELPQTSNVKVELNNIVTVVHNLFRKREDMDIKLAVPIDPVHVYADKSQLVRILNNLVKNATESIPIDRRGLIELSLYVRKDKAIIKVTDNGIGIPDEMKSKIFQPKFTTKDSGSGLGLAIAANMVESMNGKIYFESEPHQSTSFYIELDIIRQAVLTDSKERITLD